MAQIILHLLVLKLDKKDLRYVILGTSEGLPSPTPLFLGADVLEGSGIPTANHCRIHARYAKKGLATKLTFPSEVSLSGVTNIHNGAWFYNVQGVLQVVFEYHEPQIQVDIVSRLVELWKRNHSDPALPDSIQVEMYQLPKQLSGEFSFDYLLQLLKSHGEYTNLDGSGNIQTEQLFSNQENTIEVNGTRNLFSIQNDGYIISSLCTNEAQNREKRTCSDEGDDHAKEPKTFSQILDEMVKQTQYATYHCKETEISYVNALAAFLRILKSDLESNNKFSNEYKFESFLNILLDYDSVISDSVKLKTFCSPWGVSEKYNALLCLVSEWLGKKLFQFNEAISKRIEEFKSQNINHIQDLPPPQVLVQELFPQCMQLLVGHWIGLYDTKNDTPVTSLEAKSIDCDEAIPSFSQGPRKQKLGTNSQSRDDHSYSTPLETGNPIFVSKDEISSGVPPAKKARLISTSTSVILNTTGAITTTDPTGISSYKDHNYYSTSPHQTSTIENNPLTPREDHTYVANPTLELEENCSGSNSSENTRKDHTYVATNHSKKGKCSAGATSANTKDENEAVSEPTSSKRSPLVHTSQGGKELTNHVVDSSKYPFIQIILEFINNALISGVAHVVYTRLLLS